MEKIISMMNHERMNPGKKQQGNPRVALPNLTLNKHHPLVMFSLLYKEGE
jgi:hypothetical protein